jgi:hypothetical protein
MKVFVIYSITLLLIHAINGLPAGGPQPSVTSDASGEDDDSDMYMEPDEQQPEYSVVRSESRVVYSTERNSGFVPIIPNYSSISRSEVPEPSVVVIPNGEDKNPVAAEQQFFPSFFRTAPPLGHSRPQIYSPPNPAAAIAGRYTVGGTGRHFDQSILGSGDFSVIRGGTFYPDGDRPFVRPKPDEYYSSPASTFFNLNNGHGLPNAQPLTALPPQTPQSYYQEDPFENFRDFAELNAGGDPAFSHFVVVYANKNATKPHPNNSPKNIFEQLQLIDQDQEKSVDDTFDKEKLGKKSRLSRFKTKLAATKMEKKYKKKINPKDISDYSDPLIAES